ncbi:hypothetical protein CEXT_162291 [Caerostris extrusa]|uniref:Laminin IV type A domain-containing protein n=1 Tax=Caerostris extrusa TaxID=172846 RepID=A0AAV4TT62_CAEEX|nr:hypothetical protein CEXT_162291 [Caerostris extrusa]
MLLFWNNRSMLKWLFVYHTDLFHVWLEIRVLDVEFELATVEMDVDLYDAEDGIQAYLSVLPGGTLFYFAAPPQYLGNKLSSYGSFIRYTYFTSVDKTSPIEALLVLILF